MYNDVTIVCSCKDQNCITCTQGNEMRMKEGLSRIKAKASEGLHRWEEKSRDMITNFMSLFGRDGRIVSELISTIMGQGGACTINASNTIFI